MVSWYSYVSKVAQPELDGAILADPSAEHWKGFDAYLESELQRSITIDERECCVMSQFHQLADARDNLLTDGVGKFENIAVEVPRLFNEAGLRCPPLKKLNSSYHEHYSAYYSDFGREIVGELLVQDIESFEYSFEPE